MDNQHSMDILHYMDSPVGWSIPLIMGFHFLNSYKLDYYFMNLVADVLAI